MFFNPDKPQKQRLPALFLPNWAQILVISIGLLLGPLRSAGAQSSTGWKLEKEKDGIQVYTRLSPDSPLKEVRVRCEIDGTLNQLLAFLSDVDQFPTVLYRTKAAHLVRRVSDREWFYYTETELPWPARNRDLVIHMVCKPDPAQKRLLIYGNQAPGMVAEKPDIVRIPLWRAVWSVQQKDENRLVIDYTFAVNPGGGLPTCVVNLTAANGPITSFSRMEALLKHPRYQGKTYAFLGF